VHGSGELTGSSFFAELVIVWLEDLDLRGKSAPAPSPVSV
jgi:hypothetical protein